MRLSLLMGGVLMLVARVVLATTEDVFVMRLMLFGVLPAGEALGIPVLTLGIKRYTTDANRATAYGVYYSAMNVGALLSGVLTDAIRPKFEELGVLEFESLQHDGMIDWAVLEAPLEMKARVAA